jgi:hypothetical protein
MATVDAEAANRGAGRLRARPRTIGEVAELQGSAGPEIVDELAGEGSDLGRRVEEG